MGDLTIDSFNLNDLCKDSPIKILHISGENATLKFYDWNKQNETYRWMSLPEIVGFTEQNGLNGNDILQQLIDYRENYDPKLGFNKRYKSVDLLFNTFLCTAPTKNIDEIMRMSIEELSMPNSFFETYIIHKPELELLHRKSDTVMLRASPPNGALADEFKGVLKVEGINGIGWTVGHFKDFSDSHLKILFGNKHSLLKNKLMYFSGRGENYIQGDLPGQGVISPLSLAGSHISGFSLKTFPFYNHNDVSNDSWDKREVLFPLVKLEK
jgi:hypothetical protein